jgi:hypothetical protein
MAHASPTLAHYRTDNARRNSAICVSFGYRTDTPVSRSEIASARPEVVMDLVDAHDLDWRADRTAEKASPTALGHGSMSGSHTKS